MFFLNWKETFHLQGLFNVHIYKNTQKSSEASRNSSKLCIETAKINFHNYKRNLMSYVCVQHIFLQCFLLFVRKELKFSSQSLAFISD